MGKRIYVASSWRNASQPFVVDSLRKQGHEVYDFRNPKPGDNGFHWSEIDPKWQEWTPAQFREGIKHPLALDGFESDRNACEGADATVLVLPCGRSAHLELGVAVGLGQRTAVLMLEPAEPELMYKWVEVLTSWGELEEWGKKVRNDIFELEDDGQ